MVSRRLAASTALSYILFLISTLAGWNLALRIFSPLTAMLAVLLIAVCLKHIGTFWKSALLLFTLSVNDFGGGDISLSYLLDCGFG